MAEPARESAAAQDETRKPDPRKLDPRKLIWADVRTAIITCAQAASLAVTELAGRPDDDRAVEMAGLTRQAFENAVELGSRWVVSEAFLEEQDRRAEERERRAYAQGAADCKAARCRLAAVPDPG